MQIELTILIPVYNEVNLLEKLVKNILNRSSAKRYLYKKLLFRHVISKIYHYLRDVKFKSRISDV